MRLAHNDYVWKPFGYSAESARVSDEVLLWINTERRTGGYFWSFEVNEDDASIMTGYASSVEEAKQAAVDAWKNWAKKQAEDAGFIVT